VHQNVALPEATGLATEVTPGDLYKILMEIHPAGPTTVTDALATLLTAVAVLTTGETTETTGAMTEFCRSTGSVESSSLAI
jgi:hypothetical protein